jgi:hypothetical protein
MAVYVFGVTHSDVASAIAWSGTIDDSGSEPSSSRLTEVIEQFAADLGVALEAAGITPSDIPTGSNLHGSLAGALIRRCAVAWVMANTRESDAWSEAGLADWAGVMIRLRAGEYSAIGNNPSPGSRVKGVFDSQAYVTRQPSKSSRLGLWRKDTGFN